MDDLLRCILTCWFLAMLLFVVKMVLWRLGVWFGDAGQNVCVVLRGHVNIELFLHNYRWRSGRFIGTSGASFAYS